MSIELNIGLVLPDVLGTYGDDGNALVLRQRARLRGWKAEFHPINLGDPIPETMDLYTVGGGEDTAQILAADHLLQYPGLTSAAQAGLPILSVCAVLQVLAESLRASGLVIEGSELIDATSSPLAERAIGELASTPTVVGFPAGLTEPLTGFGNHLGATILGSSA